VVRLKRLAPRAAAIGFALIAAWAVVFPFPGAARRPEVIKDMPGRLCVVSLNVAKEPDPARVREDLEGAPCETVDFFLLQEVVGAPAGPNVAEQVARELGYQAVFRAPAGVQDQGLAILSRFAMEDPEVVPLKAFDLKFRSRQRFAISARARTPLGELHVWNVHLDTRINPRERLDQLQPVLSAAAQTAAPTLIGGDLNTNRFHWLGNVIPVPSPGAHVRAVRTAMEEIGFRTPFPDSLATHRILGQHLDWVFVRNLATGDAGTYPARHSDHEGIWTTLSPSTAATEQAPPPR
jgi:endonuclease/exonuclease/phosphatase family metal-dependent hydrolase